MGMAQLLWKPQCISASQQISVEKFPNSPLPFQIFQGIWPATSVWVPLCVVRGPIWAGKSRVCFIFVFLCSVLHLGLGLFGILKLPQAAQKVDNKLDRYGVPGYEPQAA